MNPKSPLDLNQERANPRSLSTVTFSFATLPVMPSDLAVLVPFPDLAVEIVQKILAQCETSTLAAVCGASFALLELASALLYLDVTISVDDLGELLCSRVRLTPALMTRLHCCPDCDVPLTLLVATGS